MSAQPESVSAERRRAMLRTAMGSAIAAALADPRVIEIMVNPDGALGIDILGEGRVDTGVKLDPAQVERIIRLVASHVRSEVHGERPIVSAELPPLGSGAGERFEGILPPVSTAPCFSIRKPAARIYTLMDYVTDGIMSAEAARLLSLSVVDRRNILVAGGTSSGKTTLANALLAEMAHLDERVILIEDTRELQSPARDTVALRTRAGTVTMGDLVRSTLAFDLTASSSARYVGPKRWTCSRLGTPVTPAGSRPSTPTAPHPRSTGSNSSFRKLSSPSRAASSPTRST
jgi:type IV secretion system protein VirB11